MADNTTLDAGSGGDTIASDDIGGVKYPRSKIVIGADGTNDGDVSSANPLPVLSSGAAAHDAAVSGSPVLIGVEAKDFDGSALPNVVSAEGDVVRAAASLYGVQYVMAVNEDGSAVGTVNAVCTNAGTFAVQAACTNAGTFAVQESGAALTALQVIDDWDESDRAKVNLIVGQAGIAAGAGAVGATVPRVTLASDDPLVSIWSSLSAQLSFDGSSNLLVAGTVNLSATDNAVLDAIAASVAGTLTVGSHAVTNAGTFAVQESGGALTALQLIDDTVYVDDADWVDGTSKHLLIGGLYQSSQQTITDGDVGPLQVDSSGNLKVAIVSGAGSGGTASTDDGAFSVGSASGTPAMGIFSADTVDAGDVGVLAMDASRRLLVSIEADNVGIGGGTQYTEDDVVPANPVGNALLVERDDALGGVTPAEGDWTQLFCDANGALWCRISGTATISGTVDLGATDNAVLDAIAASVAGTLTVGSHAVTNAGTFAVQATCTNAGTFAVQVDGAALTALQVIDNPVLVDDAAFTPATSSVTMAGFQADEGSTDSVDEGDAGAARMTLDRKQIVTVQPHTAGGDSIFKSVDIDETEEDVKTSAGQIYWIYCVNTHATAARYLKVYNATAANVTVGSTATVLDLIIPPATSGFMLKFDRGLPFDTAISVAATTGVGDADTGAPGANEVQVHIGYK